MPRPHLHWGVKVIGIGEEFLLYLLGSSLLATGDTVAAEGVEVAEGLSLPAQSSARAPSLCSCGS